jgi:hypothetical protein
MFDKYKNEDGSFKPEFYDQDYFQNGRDSKKGWLENYRFLPRRSMREAFAYIDVLGLDESSYVLDFGCAYGFIVKCLRMLEIRADGCDISSHSLQFAPEGCWNSSKPKSWREARDKGYTHLVSKDTLEHLTPKQLHKMLLIFRSIAPKFMCVVPLGDNGVYRIPEYHTEVSHIIAENYTWWVETFEKAKWKVDLEKSCYHVDGLKDSWYLKNEIGNYVFILERKV